MNQLTTHQRLFLECVFLYSFLTGIVNVTGSFIYTHVGSVYNTLMTNAYGPARRVILNQIRTEFIGYVNVRRRFFYIDYDSIENPLYIQLLEELEAKLLFVNNKSIVGYRSDGYTFMEFYKKIKQYHCNS